MDTEPINKVLTWVNNNLKSWLKTHYNIDIIAKTEHNEIKVDLIYDSQAINFNIDENDIKEIDSCGVKCDSTNLGLKNILILSDNIFYIILHSLNEENIKRPKLELSLDIDKNKKINVKLCNTINYSLLCFFVNKGIKLYADSQNLIGFLNQEKTFLEIFRILFLDALTNFPLDSKIKKSDELFLSILYRFNSCFEKKYNICTLDEYYKIENFKTEIIETDDTKDSILYSYEAMPLIYFLAAEKHDDNRFRYLDYFHVIEYFFEKSQLYNIKEILDEEIKSTRIFYDKEYLYEISKRIKRSFIKDERSLNELATLKSIVEKYIESVEFIQLDISELEKIDNLKKIDISTKSFKTKEHKDAKINDISNRLYDLRNAIAHSKSEEFKLHPTSLLMSNIKNDILLIRNICMYLFNKYCFTFSLN